MLVAVFTKPKTALPSYIYYSLIWCHFAIYDLWWKRHYIFHNPGTFRGKKANERREANLILTSCVRFLACQCIWWSERHSEAMILIFLKTLYHLFPLSIKWRYRASPSHWLSSLTVVAWSFAISFCLFVIINKQKNQMCYNGFQRGMTGKCFQCFLFVCDIMKNIGEMTDTKKKYKM